MPKEERRNIWTSTGFKRDAVRHYTRWVLLDDLSSVYRLQIQNISRELYKYLKENPTPEHAKRNMRHLAADLKENLKKQYQEDELTQSGSEWTLNIVFLSYESSDETSQNKFYFLVHTIFVAAYINAIRRIDNDINFRSMQQEFLRICRGCFYHAVCFLLCITIRINRLTVELRSCEFFLSRVLRFQH